MENRSGKLAGEKMRVRDLAKELGISSKELISQLEKIGIKGKKAPSGLSEEELEKFYSHKKGKQAQKEEAIQEVSKKPVKKTGKKKADKVITVSKLAKELGAESKVVIEEIKKAGFGSKRANSGLTQEEADRIRDIFLNPPEQKVEEKVEEKKVVQKIEEAKEKVEEKPEEITPQKNIIKIDVTTTVGELAEKMGLKPGDLIKKLLKQGIVATINQRLDLEVASLIVQEEGFEPEIVDIYEDEIEKEDDRQPQRARPRPPIVTVMGHVDHGKTSLLDYIRKSHIAQKEAGAITQHIGAYQIDHKGSKITFIDTPGHEAFTTMRLRGAQVTDIVVLVVAADDGVMPQTREAISHARLAGVPIIVAINKIDLPQANVENVKQQLTSENLIPEEWGGKTIVIPISAKTGQGVDELLDMIILQAELNEIKADPECRARGVVLEATLDKRRGPVATVIILEGTLKIGEPFICGFTGGKVRAMQKDDGSFTRQAPPGTPVEILGFSDLPQAGDEFRGIKNERQLRDIIESRKKVLAEMKKKTQVLSGSIIDDERCLRLIIKADVSGTLEAIKDALSKLSHPEVSVKIVHAGVGIINKSDVLLAEASKSMIIGFNVKVDPQAETEAGKSFVEIRNYNVIYHLIDDIKKALEGKLAPVYKEEKIGEAEVLKIFYISRIGTIAGCIVKQGRIKNAAPAQLVRDGNIVYKGEIASLRRFKEDVSEVQEGIECGILLKNFSDIKPGDIIEVFKKERIARALEEEIEK